MFGFQMGGGLTYQAPRWSIGMSCKGGVYANDATGQPCSTSRRTTLTMPTVS